ncbi:MAG: amidohydrolase, partial [Ruminococcus sp.]
MDKWSVIQYLEERAEDFYKLSDKIWENAEIRFKEKQSVKDYVAFLKNEGFSISVGEAGLKTGFRAEWGSGKPVIGFLGEYDALAGLSQKAGVSVKEPLVKDGNGHGCGHNLLGVGALMGAVGFKHYLETEGKSGTVVFYGCPAEEGGSGKTFMAREGCFDQLDLALSWHPNNCNMMPPGPVLANYSVRYSFTGKASHAAAAPEAGRSALDALELMNIGVQFLREHIPSTARIHYAITNTGGISPNIVQDR